jgi:hypothetical protein
MAPATASARFALAIVALGATILDARTVPSTGIGALTRSAARVFRGRCIASAVETVEVAGARVAVTAYTFRVREHLKGDGAGTITFRQIGTPEGGRRDLGRLVGMPVYAPGTEYVLFLLPPGAAGVTSPAGAAEGVFVVQGDEVAGVRGAAAPAVVRRSSGRTAAGTAPGSYAGLRRAVLDELGR